MQIIKNKIFTLFTLLFLLVFGGFTTEVWGRTGTGKWSVTVSVYEGSGTASASVWRYNVATADDNVKSASSTSATTKTASHTEKTSLSNWALDSYYPCYTESPSDGYAFEGWYNTSNSRVSTDPTYYPASTGSWAELPHGASDKDWSYTYKAKFIPVTVNSVNSNTNPTTNPLKFTEPGNKNATVVFNVSNADATADFNAPSISGSGWTLESWSYANNKVTVVVKFTATASTPQGANNGIVTLTSKGTSANQSKSATVSANVNLTPTLTASPTSLDFGMFTVDVDEKMSKTVSLTYNVNATNITLTDNASLAPFSATRSGSTVTVYYEPTSVGTGTWSKTLTITAKNGQNPQLSISQMVTLSGQAQAITNPEYTCGIEDNYMVDASALDLQSLWTSTSNGTITYSIVSFTPSGSNNGDATAPAITDNRYLSLGQAGTLKLKLTQGAATSYYAGEDTKTITIHKYSSVFANVADLTAKVDEDKTSAYTLTYTDYTGAPNHVAGTPTLGSESGNFYYTLVQNVTTGNTTDSNQPTWAIAYNAGNKTATGKNAGTGTVHLFQKETYKYNAADAVFVVTVTKHTPTITWAAEPYYYNSTINNFYSSDNTTTSITPNSNNEEVATISGATLTTYNKAGTARISITQAENYYWAEHTAYKDVTPGKKNNHIEFTVNSSAVYNAVKGTTQGDVSYKDNGIRLGGGGTGAFDSEAWNWSDKYIDIEFEGIPYKISFTTDITSWAASNKVVSPGSGNNNGFWYMKEFNSINGSESTIWEETGNSNPGTIERELNSNTRKVRICYTGNFAGYVKNLKITELQYFKTATESLDFGDRNQLNVEPSSQSFVVKHANAGYQTKVMAPEHYQVSLDNSSFSESVVYSTNETKRTGGDIMGEFTVYVKYLADEVGTHAGNIEVSNNLRENILVPVTATTLSQRDPVLTWNIGESLRANTTYTNFVTSTNKEAGLNIEISNDESGLLTVTCVNGVYVLTTGNLDKDAEPVTGLTITVSQDETENYNEVEPQTLIVTLSPRVNVCLPVLSMDASLMEDMRVNSKETYAWYNTNVAEVNTSYHVALSDFDVKYSQSRGIGLGTWKDGLSGLSWDKIWQVVTVGAETFSWENKYIDLSFTGVPDKLSFSTNTQTVKFNLLGVWYTVGATTPYWHVYESTDGNFGNTPIATGTGVTSFDVQLSPTTRYIRIEYDGNFTGFVQNLQITRKRYLEADKSSLTFGDANERPLQEPQIVTLNYSSIGSCDSPEAIEVESTNDAFYVDVREKFAGIDEMGSYEVRVRCTDVGKSGVLNFKVGDDTLASVNVESATPILTSMNSSTLIFRTGTEQPASENSPYRGITTYDFSDCFNAGNPRFDILYIYGVSASAVDKRDSTSSWSGLLPAINLAEGNVHTPCFVYAIDKDNNRYVYTRTFDAATTTLNISAADKKKIAFMGYKPAKLNGDSIPAIQLNGNAGEQTELYLHNSEIMAKDAVLKVNSSSNENHYVAKLIINGLNNKFIANSNAAIQLSSNASKLVIAEGLDKLALIPSATKPSIDLGSANGSVEIKGSQVELHNAALNISGHNVNMAIANMSGADKTTGSVLISDGTITSDDGVVLGMPLNTIINGGTFNDIENVVTFDRKGRTIRPKNSRNELLALTEKTRGQLPDWYGKTYLIEVAGKVFPMLEDESICKFMATTDQYSNHNSNWTSIPSNTTDVLISRNMEVKGTLEVKSFTINPDVKVTVKEGATLKVGDYDSFWENTGSLQIAKGGKVELTEGVVSVKDLTIEASLGSTVNNLTTPASSGEVNEENLLDVNGDVYFKLELDPSGRNTYGWYDFVVPFEVDVIGGISIAEAPGARMVFNGNYAIMAFDERRRAETGKGWSKFTGTMVPGQVYTITLDETQPWNTVVFKKKIGASLAGERSITSSYSNDVGEEKDRGWNGYGNATLHHTKLNAPGVSLIQVYDHTNKCYQAREAAAYKIAVGMSFFMQVDDKTVVALDEVQSDAKGGGGYLAPARESRDVETFRLSLTKEGQNYASDLLWVSASEEATGEYVIGHDLAKMGDLTSSKVARMWAKNNNIDLCDIEMPLVYGQASCELNMYVPEQATYTIAVEQAPEDAELFLTYNGKVIWNLTSSPAEIVLNSGLKTDFGLILKSHNASEIAEGVDNIDEDNHSVRKVLIDNTIYVLTPDGAMYDLNGKLIR